VPAHVVLNGVMIVHASVIPMLVASQSHAPLLGTHCLMTLPPTDWSWHV
jgi:hypothetical protein